MNDGLFEMEPRRPLLTGDAVVVDTVIGKKTARIARTPVDGMVWVNWTHLNKRGKLVARGSTNIPVGRVSHDE